MDTLIRNYQLERALRLNWLIATDLDGTLLDDDYPLEVAAAAIDGLFELPEVAGCPVRLRVVLATSKTLAEGARLAGRCASRPILAFENGAGIAWRAAACTRRGTERLHGYEIESGGVDYGRIRRRLLRLREKPGYRFRGFGDMSAQEVAGRTGLDEESAALAKQRMASEPLVWQGTRAALQSFQCDLGDLGLTLELGGRFHHVAGRRNKAGAVAAIRRYLAREGQETVVTLACGDAPNDAEMMLAADYALVFPGRNGGYALPAGSTVIHAPGAGPETWQYCVSRIIQSNSQEADSG